MAIQIVRFRVDNMERWGVHRDGGIVALNETYPTTRSFFEDGGPEASQSTGNRAVRWQLNEVTLLSPVTPDGDYICQATNYASHLREIGRDPASQIHNVFFTKASSCIDGPNADVVKPRHVQLLDYEIELGLVVSKAITGPLTITPSNIHEFVGGWVITNDISAREIQVSHEQFHKAKSYRTFGPTGPFLLIPTVSEAGRWGELILSLSVNGERRQFAKASEMIFDPMKTLSELSAIRNLKPGDMIATGTPAGVALRVPGKFLMALAKWMSPEVRYKAFLRSQMKVDRYLKPGDLITATIATHDGALTLGEQRNRIVDA